MRAPGHRVRAGPPPPVGAQPVAAPLPARAAARQACRVPDDPHRVVVRPARVIGSRRRLPSARVVGPGWRPGLVVMRRRGRFVSFFCRRRLDRRGRRRWGVRHKPRAAGGDWRAVRDVVRVEWTANAGSGIAPRARAFRISRAHRRTRRIGWVIRAFVSHGWTTTGRNPSQGQRAVVPAVGSDCKADQHSSRASGSGNDADRPGRFPRPPLIEFALTSLGQCAREVTSSPLLESR